MAFWNTWQERLPIKIVLLISLGIILFGFSIHRQLGAYGVETDFYGGFVPEAKRVLAGESLHMEWHPPLYSFLLAGVFMLLGDWFRSGLLISVISAVLAVGAVHSVFRDLYGRFAGWGAALGLALWPQFLVLAISASSDVLFLSLMMTSLAVGVGGETFTNRRSFFAGLLAGLAALTRTNGFTLLLIVLLAAKRAKANTKINSAVIALGGFLFPWVGWFVTSHFLESPIFPVRTYIDIATTFFNPEGARWSGNSDNWILAEKRFSSLSEVLLFDPRTLILDFIHNLLLNAFLFFEFAGVFSVVFASASLLCILWLLTRKTNNRLVLPFWLIYASQYSVLALRTFDTRYFLFLVPAIIAGAFSLAATLIDFIGGKNALTKTIARLAFGLLLLLLVIINAKLLVNFIKREPVEVIEAVALLKTISSGQEYILARKPHIRFYSGLAYARIPLAQSERELYRDVCFEHQRREIFLFFGREEARLRPGLRSLQTPASAPDWLLPVGYGEPVGSSWVLYRANCSVP
jgi:4-amino-4-deoxy-L-arabinose transferase-like glycosyltransferase